MNNKLKQISDMKYNWNGYGTDPIPASIIEKSNSILEHIVVQPEIFPTATPGIQLEYDNEGGDYLEIEILEDSIEVLLQDNNGKAREINVFTIEDINKIVVDFMRGDKSVHMS